MSGQAKVQGSGSPAEYPTELDLKKSSYARNNGCPRADLHAPDEPRTSVVSRPTSGVGKGYALVGHHEILIPLLAASLTRP